jgi:hypothetical protein
MTESEEAEAAAAAEGRKVSSYEVVGKPLLLNGQAYNEGDLLKFSKADADILIEAGRLKLPNTKAKKAE